MKRERERETLKENSMFWSLVRVSDPERANDK